MPIYVISIDIKTREDYEIDAQNTTNATYKVAEHIMNGGEPTRRIETGRFVRKPQVVLPDDIVPEDV